jgi:hypothetical protein
MIFGLWEPKDPAVRKWLLSGVVISVVGAVVGFGVQQFNPPKHGENSEQSAKPGTAATLSNGSRQPTTSGSATPGTAVDQSKTDTEPGAAEGKSPSSNGPTTAAIPADVRDWAEHALGQRPILSPDVDSDYPPCVARLRNAAQADPDAARDCKRDLQSFHLSTIVAYYDVKGPYDRKLEREDALLRKGSLLPDELPRYNYIIAEMDRLNGEDSAEDEAVHRLEERLLSDIKRCAKSACR